MNHGGLSAEDDLFFLPDSELGLVGHLVGLIDVAAPDVQVGRGFAQLTDLFDAVSRCEVAEGLQVLFVNVHDVDQRERSDVDWVNERFERTLISMNGCHCLEQIKDKLGWVGQCAQLCKVLFSEVLDLIKKACQGLVENPELHRFCHSSSRAWVLLELSLLLLSLDLFAVSSKSLLCFLMQI